VVAPAVNEEIRREPGVMWEERAYQRADLEGQRLVIAAADDTTVNAAVFGDAEAAGLWVNGADDPAHCSFTLPSVVRRGALQVTVSTGGRSPGLARWWRELLESEIGPEYEVLLDLLADERQSIRATGRSTEDLDWQSALDSDMLALIRSGDVIQARERLRTCLSSS